MFTYRLELIEKLKEFEIDNGITALLTQNFSQGDFEKSLIDHCYKIGGDTTDPLLLRFGALYDSLWKNDIYTAPGSPQTDKHSQLIGILTKLQCSPPPHQSRSKLLAILANLGCLQFDNPITEGHEQKMISCILNKPWEGYVSVDVMGIISQVKKQIDLMSPPPIEAITAISSLQ